MGYKGDKGKETENMIKVDLPLLSLPDKWENVTVRLLTPPEKYIGDGNEGDENGEVRGFFAARCEVLVNDLADSLVLGNEYLLEINSTIYKGMLMECKKNNIVVDKDLKCMTGKVWTIKGVEWPSAPKELWTIDEVTRLPIAPKTYRISLRKDLEIGKDGSEYDRRYDRRYNRRYNRRRHNMIDNTVGMENLDKNAIVSFGIEGRILNNILPFLVSVNREIPIKFGKDNIIIYQKSCDNVQYAQIDIRIEELFDYKLDEDVGESHEIIIDTDGSTIENISGIYETAKKLNTKSRFRSPILPPIGRIDETIMDIGDFDDFEKQVRSKDFKEKMEKMGPTYYVDVKVYENRIEFYCPDRIMLWANLIDNKKDGVVTKQHKILNGICDKIKAVRNNQAVKVGTAIIPSGEFRKICETKEEETYGRSYLTQISREDGLILVSKSCDEFHELKLKPKCLKIKCEDNEKHHSCFEKEFMEPFVLLESEYPIRLELRTNKPLIMEQELVKSKGVYVMLTIAPRMPEEYKKGSENERNENERSENEKKVEEGIIEQLEDLGRKIDLKDF